MEISGEHGKGSGEEADQGAKNSHFSYLRSTLIGAFQKQNRPVPHKKLLSEYQKFYKIFFKYLEDCLTPTLDFELRRPISMEQVRAFLNMQQESQAVETYRTLIAFSPADADEICLSTIYARRVAPAGYLPGGGATRCWSANLRYCCQSKSVTSCLPLRMW